MKVHKQQVGAFLLRHGRSAPYKRNWGARYRRWLQEQKFEHPADQIVLQEYVEAAASTSGYEVTDDACALA